MELLLRGKLSGMDSSKTAHEVGKKRDDRETCQEAAADYPDDTGRSWQKRAPEQTNFLDMEFDHLPDELLLIIFMYADLFTQRKVRRMSKRWRSVLHSPELTENVLLDVASFCRIGLQYEYGVFLRRHYSTPEAVTWPEMGPAVRRIIFSGHQEPTAAYDMSVWSELLQDFTTRCPNLELVSFVRVVWEDFVEWCDWCQSDCSLTRIVTASRGNVRVISRRGVYDIPAPDRVTDLAYIINEAVLTPFLTYAKCSEALLWPYQAGQMDWLIDSIGRLSGDARWLHWLSNTNMLPTVRDFLSEKPVEFAALFSEGGIRTAGKDALFELIEVEEWLIMAAYILTRRDLTFARPPERFHFETDDFCHRTGELDINLT